MKIVAKLGTSVLTGGTGRLKRPVLVDVARQIATLRQQGHQVILVSSAAIAAGRERLTPVGDLNPRVPETLSQKQVLAAVGQVHLMSVWQQTFDVYDIPIGQMLLTRADLDDRERFLNARDTLEGLLESRILPIINENDAVATTEIKVGDNDNLSASVALLADADLLILLTDQPGLMTANPNQNPDAQLIREVSVIDEGIRLLAGGASSGLGTGGMMTKLQAAQTARSSGVDVAISGTGANDFLCGVVQGVGQFTWIPKTNTRLESRKRWILGGPASTGQLTLDAGAVNAVQQNKRSLLAKGLTQVHGAFQRGDVVTMIDRLGNPIARGIVRYSAGDLHRICGKHSTEIPAILGYHLGDAVVHRDELVVL